MKPGPWLDDLQALSWRSAGLGLAPDIATLTLAEAWFLYRFLCRMAGGADA